MSLAADRPRPPGTRLLERVHGVRSRLAVAAGLSVGAAALVLVGAWLTAIVVAGVFLGGAGPAEVALPLAAIGILALVRAPLLVAADVVAQSASGRMRASVRADLTRQLLALGPGYAGRERTGELAGVLVDGLDAIDAWVTTFLPARALAVAVPVLVLGAVLVLDPPTMLVLLFTGPILVLLLGFIGGRTRAITERRFAEVRWLGAFFVDMLAGIATLKAFGRSAEQVDTMRSISRQYGDTTMEVLRTAFQTALVLEWGAAVAVALVAVEISLRLVAGAIEFDRALAVLIIVPEFFLPLRQLATRYHAGSAGQAAATRILAILDEPVSGDRGTSTAGVGPAIADPADVARAAGHLAAGGIRFEDVTVTYPGRTEPALRGIELAIPPRGLVALVGASGAGKSTIANVLLRFVEPGSGRVVVGELSLATIPVRAWRAQVAWVAQRPHLFHGTIADNIRLADPAADDDVVAAAVRQAGAGEFIARLPLGLGTPVGDDGVRLSGGQRQRIAIARAILGDARLVVLDEATSQLDEASESAIRATLRTLAADRAVVVVSHRLRLAADADLVAVVEAGRIVETGAPGALLARRGAYARLVATETDGDELGLGGAT